MWKGEVVSVEPHPPEGTSRRVRVVFLTKFSGSNFDIPRVQYSSRYHREDDERTQFLRRFRSDLSSLSFTLRWKGTHLVTSIDRCILDEVRRETVFRKCKDGSHFISIKEGVRRLQSRVALQTSLRLSVINLVKIYVYFKEPKLKSPHRKRSCQRKLDFRILNLLRDRKGECGGYVDCMLLLFPYSKGVNCERQCSPTLSSYRYFQISLRLKVDPSSVTKELIPEQEEGPLQRDRNGRHVKKE